MREPCELCHHETLTQVYEPERSTRGLKIYLCNHCGLVQSLPRVDRAPRRAAAVSGGADWGNVRYGKAFRTDAAMKALSRHARFNGDIALLDVGSNRGSFVKAFLEAAPSAHILALEPDERVADSCKDLERTDLIVSRIEDAALETGRFDIVHSCHTIEHLAHPQDVLADHWRVLKPGGLLVLDAPNIAILDESDMIEEWFIDKHLYHFSARTLIRMVRAAGFDIVEAPDAKDRANILIVARKSDKAIRAKDDDPLEVSEAMRLIAAYGATRARNLAALTAAAADIARMAPRKVAMWGAGRLFDSLVTHGGFEPAMLSALIDKHLKQYVGERHGRALVEPAALAETQPGVVIVMSRGFAQEIADEAKALAPQAEIIFYSDLMARARQAA
ncbi:MAG: class I SAM-dependent methyltransferase [Proteobacteria bacterium]|nr:class I SAM-dependent methyltransferase [Pseudomonadota bacterium]